MFKNISKSNASQQWELEEDLSLAWNNRYSNACEKLLSSEQKTWRVYEPRKDPRLPCSLHNVLWKPGFSATEPHNVDKIKDLGGKLGPFGVHNVMIMVPGTIQVETNDATMDSPLFLCTICCLVVFDYLGLLSNWHHSQSLLYSLTKIQFPAFAEALCLVAGGSVPRSQFDLQLNL